MYSLVVLGFNISHFHGIIYYNYQNPLVLSFLVSGGSYYPENNFKQTTLGLEN